MTIARAHLVDPASLVGTTASPAVSAALFLFGEGEGRRKLWIDNRLRELAGIFSIAVGGFSVLDNHLHLLVRQDLGMVQKQVTSRGWLGSTPEGRRPQVRGLRWGLAGGCQLDPSHPGLVTSEDAEIEPCLDRDVAAAWSDLDSFAVDRNLPAIPPLRPIGWAP